MKEMREVAMAYYAKKPDDQTQLVWSLFERLARNGDGKVSIQEYLDFAEEIGFSRYLTPNLFKLHHKNDDNTLDFEERFTLNYGDNTPAVVKSHSKSKELEEGIRRFETGVRLAKIVHDVAVAHPAAVDAVHDVAINWVEFKLCTEANPVPQTHATAATGLRWTAVAAEEEEEEEEKASGEKDLAIVAVHEWLLSRPSSYGDEEQLQHLHGRAAVYAATGSGFEQLAHLLRGLSFR
ncbi:hypothetical protein Vadar_007555 [Vaccinium darrowii]|uniref:Uncharacterized protein n=1 Tax=Vaccinium darrowii TaxID=229202 RepID=A0ACB7YVL8_9ERIC|nr:hypothetical protein Vadar_007555 [Vaccinium darrowii]